jgi:hydrogenase nickel incorporation protein HypB
VLITKIDLLPHLPVRLERIGAHIRDVNPAATVLPLSAASGEGFEAWHRWIEAAVAGRQAADLAPLAHP